MIDFDEIDRDMIDFVRATAPARLAPARPVEFTSSIVHIGDSDQGAAKKPKPEEVGATPPLVSGVPLATVYDLTNTGQGWNVYNGEAIHAVISMGISMNSSMIFSDDVQIINWANNWDITNPTRPDLHITGPSPSLFFNQATWVPPLYPDSLYVQVDAYSPFYTPVHGDFVVFTMSFRIRHTTRGNNYAEQIVQVGPNWVGQPDPSVANGDWSTFVV